MHCLLLLLRGPISFIGIKLSPHDLCLSFRSNSDSLTHVVHFRQDAVEHRKSSRKWLVIIIQCNKDSKWTVPPLHIFLCLLVVAMIYDKCINSITICWP